MLKIKNISYKLNNINLFDNISFEVDNWIIGIFWPSGSWKTTFLKIIGWYLKPTRWSIIYNNELINTKNILSYRRKIWFHFQDYNLLDLTAQDNINLPFIIWKYKKDKKRINYLLEYFEVKNLINKQISQISWGERERISIIKAFSIKPKLVLLDEAGSALDSKLKQKLYEFVKNYAKDNIILFVSHDKEIENILSKKVEFKLIN